MSEDILLNLTVSIRNSSLHVLIDILHPWSDPFDKMLTNSPQKIDYLRVDFYFKKCSAGTLKFKVLPIFIRYIFTEMHKAGKC